MQTKVTAGKTLKRAGATPLFGGPSAKSSWGHSRPSRRKRDRVSLRAGSRMQVVMLDVMESRITKGAETLGTTESTIEATENDDPAGPFGG